MSAMAHPFVETALGRRWLPMAPALTIFGIWATMRSLEGSMAWFLNALGHARVVGLVSAALLLPLLAGIVLGALSGITAVAAVILAHTCALVGFLAYAIQRHAGVTARAQLRAMRGVLLAATAAWVAAALVSRLTDSHFPAVGSLLFGSLLGVLAYIATIVLVDRRLIRDFLAHLERLRRSREPHFDASGPELNSDPTSFYAPRASS